MLVARCHQHASIRIIPSRYIYCWLASHRYCFDVGPMSARNIGPMSLRYRPDIVLPMSGQHHSYLQPRLNPTSGRHRKACRFDVGPI
jgi:hypothetical protein